MFDVFGQVICPNTLKCQLKGDVLRQIGPLIPTLDLFIQILEFMFIHDKYIDQTIKKKTNNYNSLIEAIQAQDWKHKSLIKTLHISPSIMKNLMKAKDQIAIK